MSIKKSQLKSHNHCVFQISYHIVFVTKYRRKCLTKNILTRLNEIILEVCERWNIDLLEFGGEADHIHLLVETHPNVLPSRFINPLKTLSSRYIRKEFEDYLKKYYWKKPVLWTRAYCLLSAGGAPINTIKKYIENQGEAKPYRKKSNSAFSAPRARFTAPTTSPGCGSACIATFNLPSTPRLQHASTDSSESAAQTKAAHTSYSPTGARPGGCLPVSPTSVLHQE